MKELPKPSNETYIYVRESGEGKTVDEAMAQAMVRVFQNTANRLGQPFDSQKVTAALLSGTDYKTISAQYNVPVNRVGIYNTRLDNGNYWVYVLCQVAAMGDVEPQWDRVGLTSSATNWISFAKSAIIPGLGQIGKDHVAEGILTFVGEAALIGSGYLCYSTAQKQLNIMRTDGISISEFTNASQKYNSMQLTSYIAWGAAGALYIVNLIRSITAQPHTPYDLTFSPSVISSPFQTMPTVGLTLRF